MRRSSSSPILDLAYYSGWRKQEILGLTWEEIDEAGGVIRLSPARSKTLVGRVLPISQPIAEAIARRRARRDPDSPLVFHRAQQDFATMILDNLRKAGHRNILKRLLIHLAGFNLGVLFRQLIGVGTPRSLQGRCLAALMVLVSSWRRLVHVWTVREPEYPARSTIGVGDHDRSLIPKAA